MNRTSSMPKSVLRYVQIRICTLIWTYVCTQPCSQIKRLRGEEEFNSFDEQKNTHDLNTKQVRYSDPHCKLRTLMILYQ